MSTKPNVTSSNVPFCWTKHPNTQVYMIYDATKTNKSYDNVPSAN